MKQYIKFSDDNKTYDYEMDMNDENGPYIEYDKKLYML